MLNILYRYIINTVLIMFCDQFLFLIFIIFDIDMSIFSNIWWIIDALSLTLIHVILNMMMITHLCFWICLFDMYSSTFTIYFYLIYAITMLLFIMFAKIKWRLPIFMLKYLEKLSWYIFIINIFIYNNLCHL